MTFWLSRTRVCFAAAVIALLALLASSSLVPVGSAEASQSPTWNSLDGFPYLQIPTSVSCPSASVCVAVGLTNYDNNEHGSIMTSTNGGVTWTPQTLPTGVGGLSGVSCASTTSCIAVGGGHIIATVDGGVTWIKKKIKGVLFTGISCASPTSCVAVGNTFPDEIGHAFTTVDGGTIWTEGSLPTDVLLNGVSCAASTDKCVIVGRYDGEYGDVDILYTSANGGATWSGRPVPSGVSYLNGVSCPSAKSCVAVGPSTMGPSSIIVSNDGGKAWTNEPVPSGTGATGPLAGVSSATTADCVAVVAIGSVVYGGQALTTSDGGATWTLENLSAGTGANSVSCASVADCVAVGTTETGDVITTSDGGSTWTNQQLPNAAGPLGSVSCSTVSSCVTTDGGHLLTTSDGALWSQGQVPPGDGSFSSVACSTPSDCVTVGGYFLVTTTDGGATWADHTIPANLYGVSCSSPMECIAVGGGSIIATTDGGTTWTNQTAPVGPQLFGISCASPADCVAVGEATVNHERPAIVATSDGGATWTNEAIPIPKGPTGKGILFSVSCSSTTTCAAAGDNLVYTTSNGGTTWTRETLSGTVRSVSCGSSADCVAVGPTNMFTTSDGGIMWTSSPMPDGVSSLGGVSCVSSTQCVGVGENSQSGGIVFGYNDPTVALTPTTTTTSASPISTVPESPVVYSASVVAQEGSGIPSGSVTFTTGTVWLCTATLTDGSGSCSDATAPLGSDTVAAVYSGDLAFASSSATTGLR